MYIDILLISIIVVIITDLSGFPQSIYSMISKYLTNGKINTQEGQIKILTCSLCQTWWIGLIYYLCIGSVSILSISYLLLISYMTDVIKDLLIFIKDLLKKTIHYLYEKTI